MPTCDSVHFLHLPALLLLYSAVQFRYSILGFHPRLLLSTQPHDLLFTHVHAYRNWTGFPYLPTYLPLQCTLLCGLPHYYSQFILPSIITVVCEGPHTGFNSSILIIISETPFPAPLDRRRRNFAPDFLPPTYQTLLPACHLTVTYTQELFARRVYCMSSVGLLPTIPGPTGSTVL